MESDLDHVINRNNLEADWRDSLTTQLCDLTKRWNIYNDVPSAQQSECRAIGRKLNDLGGFDMMQQAYYDAHDANKAASVIAAYWDGIGDWRW